MRIGTASIALLTFAAAGLSTSGDAAILISAEERSAAGALTPAAARSDVDKAQLATGSASGSIGVGAIVGAGAVTPVPEPAAWLLLIAGFSAGGFVLRRGNSEVRQTTARYG